MKKLTALVIAGLLGAVTATPLVADDGCDAEWTVFATGLTNPRHIRVGPDGLLYVAEAGVGGERLAPASCPLDNMFNQTAPYKGGLTGRVSRVHPNGRVETVARGIASFVDGTAEVLGPTDVEWIGDTLYVLTEGGGCTRGLPNHPAGILRVGRDGTPRYVADVTAFIRANPVASEPVCGPAGDCEPDGVPHSMVAVGPYLYVIETNHNSILRVDPRSGDIQRLHDLSVLDPAPIRIIRRGDAALIGTFDGDLLEMGLFGGPVSFLQSGLNPVVDLTRLEGRLFLLETFTWAEPFAGNAGRVLRRGKDGALETIASGFNFPIGLAHWRGDLYVSQNSYFQGPVRGTGEIAKIRCRDRRSRR
jgi:hypothetical protein